MEKIRDLFKKIGDTKGIFHTKMGTIKDRNSVYLTQAEEMAGIHKRTIQKEKKDLTDLYNHDGVITHLEPDIMD